MEFILLDYPSYVCVFFMPPVTSGDRKSDGAFPGVARLRRTYPRRMLLRGQAGEGPSPAQALMDKVLESSTGGNNSALASG